MHLGVALIVLGSLGNHLLAQDRGDIVCWGTNHSDSCITRTGPFLHVDHGYKHVVGLRADGTLLLEGNNDRGQLDIPAGTAVRFEPGQSREVTLVAYAGARAVYGFRGEVMGPLEDEG